jgi:hypothetical protein
MTRRTSPNPGSQGNRAGRKKVEISADVAEEAKEP